jgi:hypothetical protein
MHRDHDHAHHHHGHEEGHSRHGDDGGHRHDHGHAGPGHNHAHQPRGVVQWQTPHLDPQQGRPDEQGEPDLDHVEAAFVEGFLAAGDPTSFLRLASIPFEAKAADGARLVLLRVEIDAVADVGSITPHLGGGSFRYDPMPKAMVSRRRRLRFVYFDGSALRPLTFAAVRTDLAPGGTSGGTSG